MPGDRRYNSTAWRKLRLQVLREEGWKCYACGAPATSVDHIVPGDEAPARFLERSNLRASCVKHNEGRVSGRLARMARINREPAPVRQW